MIQNYPSTKMNVFLIITFLSPFIFTASAIKCYMCASALDAHCDNDIDMSENFKIDCDQVAPAHYISNDLATLNATACMKKIYKENKSIRYVRNCYFGEVNETEIGCRMDPSAMGLTDVQCFVCDDANFCNTARSNIDIGDSLSKLITLLIFILMAKFLN